MLRGREALVVIVIIGAVILAGAVIVGAATFGGGGGGAPSAAATRNSPAAKNSPAARSGALTRGTALCHSQTLTVDGGAYTVQNNEWGSGAPECVAAASTGDFGVSRSSIANSTSGAPGGYPSIYRGCHWGACTSGSGLPVPVARLLSPGTVTTSWTTTQPGTGAYDVAYDIWFNQTATTSGQPDGAELMIWLNHHGPVQPFGSQVATATIGGRSYQVWYGKQGWNTISYSLTSGTTSVRDLDIGQFAADAASRGYLSASWYLIDVEAGFELWQGGAGLATDSFTVSAPAAGPVAAASCTVRYSVVNSWPGGFEAQAVLTNTSQSPVNGWTLAWSFAGDQRVTELWNGVSHQSGQQVSVANAAYNSAIAPGMSVTIGFNGSGDGSGDGAAPPAAFQLNGTQCQPS